MTKAEPLTERKVRRRERVAKDAIAPKGKAWCPWCKNYRPGTKMRAGQCSVCRRAAEHTRRLWALYRMTSEQYWRIYELQNGKCAICQRATGKSKKLSLDHDHNTGQVRGLLCNKCNYQLLGCVGNSLEILKRAVAYIETPPNPLGSHRVPRIKDGTYGYRNTTNQLLRGKANG